MPCSKEIFTDNGPTTIWWGMLAMEEVVNPFTVEFADDAQIDTFLAMLDSEDGPYRAGGYDFPFVPPIALGAASWFIVPEVYDTPLAATGFQFAWGLVGAPTDNVLTLSESIDVNTNYSDTNKVGNFFTNEVLHNTGVVGNYAGLANGWYYFARNIGAFPYRFYVFMRTVSYVAVPDTTIGYGRAANVASVAPGSGVITGPWPEGLYYEIIIPAVTALNESGPYYDFGSGSVSGFGALTYANVGGNIADTLYALGTVNNWFRGTEPFGLVDTVAAPPDTDFTMFIVT